MTKLDPDPLAAHFCAAVKDFIGWNEATEAAYGCLVKAIIATVQNLDELRDFELEEAANASAASEAGSTTTTAESTGSSAAEADREQCIQILEKYSKVSI